MKLSSLLACLLAFGITACGTNSGSNPAASGPGTSPEGVTASDLIDDNTRTDVAAGLEAELEKVLSAQDEIDVLNDQLIGGTVKVGGYAVGTILSSIVVGNQTPTLEKLEARARRQANRLIQKELQSRLPLINWHTNSYARTAVFQLESERLAARLFEVYRKGAIQRLSQEANTVFNQLMSLENESRPANGPRVENGVIRERILTEAQKEARAQLSLKHRKLTDEVSNLQAAGAAPKSFSRAAKNALTYEKRFQLTRESYQAIRKELTNPERIKASAKRTRTLFGVGVTVATLSLVAGGGTLAYMSAEDLEALAKTLRDKQTALQAQEESLLKTASDLRIQLASNSISPEIQTEVEAALLKIEQALVKPEASAIPESPDSLSSSGLSPDSSADASIFPDYP